MSATIARSIRLALLLVSLACSSFGMLGCRSWTGSLLEIHGHGRWVRLHTPHGMRELPSTHAFPTTGSVRWAEVGIDDRLSVLWSSGELIELALPSLDVVNKRLGVLAAGRATDGSVVWISADDGIVRSCAAGRDAEIASLDNRIVRQLTSKVCHLSYNADGSLAVVATTNDGDVADSMALAFVFSPIDGRQLAGPLMAEDVHFVDEDTLLAKPTGTDICRRVQYRRSGLIAASSIDGIGCIWARASEREHIIARRRSPFIPLATWVPLVFVDSTGQEYNIPYRVGVLSRIVPLSNVLLERFDSPDARPAGMAEH